mgnify:CR=1 FL=1
MILSGGQLWVEVIKNLTEGEELVAEFCDPTKDGKLYQQESNAETMTQPSSPPKHIRTQSNNQTGMRSPEFFCIVFLLFINMYMYWPLFTAIRPSHTTTETAKKVVIVHTHYNFFSQLQRFF